jgi:glycosyltransferase involved in cell wall biosynthesis
MRDTPKKLNILTFATHERYEESLCKTGHNFYSLRYGKEWDTTYAPIPENYHIIDSLPESLDIDLVLSHTSCNRLQVAHDILTGTTGMAEQAAPPILRHCHVLPDVRFDVDQQIKNYNSLPIKYNSFISEYNRDKWGLDQGYIIEHGVDTEFWGESYSNKTMPYKENHVLSVVNEFPTRDWCCGFNLWKEVASSTPCQVVGKCTGEHAGFSQPAESREHLRQLYQTAAVFLNTSLHSPVPTVMLEAMACGCPVVTTGTCMIPEIIEHGVNGIIANNASDLKFWCRELLDKPDLARKIGEAGRQTILSDFNLKRFIDGWNQLFYHIIGEWK